MESSIPSQGTQPEGNQPEGNQSQGNLPQGNRPPPTPAQIKDALIAQRIERWKTKQMVVPDNNIAIVLAGNCFDYRYLPCKQHGCLLPNNQTGGYVYVPYDDSKANLPADLLNRMQKLDAHIGHPMTALIMVQVDKLMEEEVDAECFFEFLDGGDASEVDFQGKIRILARYKMAKNGIDVTPDNPEHPEFRFGLTDVNDTGKVTMKWNILNWACTAQTVLECMEAYSRQTYHPLDMIPRQVRELGCIHQPEDAAKEAQALAVELTSQSRIVGGEKPWAYFLCKSSEGNRRMEDQAWTPLGNLDDIRMMKRLAREHSMWPIIMRPRQLRHYRNQLRIHELQQRQEQYCLALETAQKEA